jgi:hypothetical protein
MKRALLVVAFALALVPSAAGIESTIYPGVGIGKVRLHMTETQVKKALGIWQWHSTEDGALSVGWNFSTWTAFFRAGRLVEVSTQVRTQKTRDGIGPGSSWHALVAAYSHGLCAIAMPHDATTRMAELLVPHSGGTQTLYYVVSTAINSVNGTWSTWRVAEVHVRTPWRHLAEFDPNLQHPLACNSNWRTGDPE